MRERSRYEKLADDFAQEMYACRDPRDRIMLALKWLKGCKDEDFDIVVKEYDRRFPDGDVSTVKKSY